MANLNFNEIILGGRLTAKPELKQTQTGVYVASFSVAVNRRTSKDEQQQADFFNVTAWRATAEFVAKYFDKGSSILLKGELRNRNWTDNAGQKHYATDVIATDIYFVDAKGEKTPQVANEQPAMTEVQQNEELPF